MTRYVSISLLAAGLLVSSAGCASRDPDPTSGRSNPFAGVVGDRWRVTEVRDRLGALAVRSSIDAQLGFTRDHYVVADDTVNPLSGRYRLTHNGYEVRDAATGTIGGTGGDPDRERIVNDIDTLFRAPASRDIDPGFTAPPPFEVAASVHGDVLRLRRSGITVTLIRTGHQPDVGTMAPSATTTVSNAGVPRPAPS